MSDGLNLTTEETAALDRIETELKGSPGRTAAGTKAFAAEDMGGLCKKYQALKGSLEVLVKILKKIPGFGGKAAAALEFLMGIADTVCPA
jgi:hypothetical protein